MTSLKAKALLLLAAAAIALSMSPMPAALASQQLAYATVSTTTASAAPSKTISASSKALAIYRVSDGTLIYKKRAKRELSNASTTKMMTALIILEEGNLDKTATISKKAANTPYGNLYAHKGDKIKVKNLLRSLLISSSNDSATALAEFSAGSVKAFARKMNKKAKELGCTGTHFVNPHGLTAKGHHSTARDLCVIQTACLSYKLYRTIIGSKSYKYRDCTGKKRYSGSTTDRLLGHSKRFLGGKTGFTNAAGCCFSGVYRWKGELYVFTVLGNSSSYGRWSDCRKAIRWIKENAASLKADTEAA